MRHKHAEIIVDWVQGCRIQGQSPSTNEWVDVPDVDQLHIGNNYLLPSPIHPDYDWWDNWRIAARYDMEIEHDDYSCLHTVEEFKQIVESGAFIDYDGFGYPVKNNMADCTIYIYPSEIHDIPQDATHILWYNR